MKIAHLIMAYKNPSQLERLIKRLEHPQCHIFVHLDKKIDVENFEYLQDISGVSFIRNRTVCNWGGFNFVKAVTKSTKEILERSERFDFVNLLSAQDYPIKPVELIVDYFEKHKGISFISYDESTNSEWWKHAKNRYELYHFSDVNIKGIYFLQKIINRIMPKRLFPNPFKMYGGPTSTWWVLSRDCAEFVIDYLERNPKLVKFMRFTWAADEFLYTSIIMNSSFSQRVKNNNFRHIVWKEGKSNPETLNSVDLIPLQKSENFFARKFDTTIDVKILDLLDEVINYRP